MAAGGRSGSRLTGARLLVVLVVAIVGLAALLARQAWTAARAQRAAAAQALRDNASYATANVWYNAVGRIYGGMTALFAPVLTGQGSPAPDEPPDPVVLRWSAERIARCACAPAIPADWFFRLDLRTRGLDVRGGAPDEAVRRWLADTVAAHAAAVYQPDFDFATLFAARGDTLRVIGYTIARDGAGRARAAYGFTASAAEFGEAVFGDVWRPRYILPPSLGDTVPNDSVLSVLVRAPGGAVVYASPRQYPAGVWESRTARNAYGDLDIAVGLRPAALAAGWIARPPPSPVLLFAALGLAAALAVVAVAMLRREQELVRLRADFTSSVSHELRTPLAQIMLFADTLQLGRTRSGEEQRDAARIIAEEARRLLHLVENVLTASRAEHRSLRLSRRDERLLPLVRRVVADFAPIAGAAGARIAIAGDGRLAAPVDADAVRQMLLNLLDNAVRHGGGSARVTVAAAPDSSGAAWIVVEDDGDGIAEADRGRVFERFVRLERAAAGASAGSGIGLAVVRELAALHGGRAWAEAAAGGGARLVIALPGGHRVPDDDDAVPAAAPAPAGEVPG